MDPVNVLAKFQVRRFTRSWDNGDWSFRWGLWTSNLGKGRSIGGWEWYHPIPKVLVSSYRPSIQIIHLSGLHTKNSVVNFACRWSFFCAVYWPFWYSYLFYIII